MSLRKVRVMPAANGLVLLAVAAALVAAPPAAVAAQTSATPTNPSTAKDYAIIARDIIPSGQYGALPAPTGSPMLAKEEQQAEMYNALTPLFNHVTTADVFDDFKPEPVGSAVKETLTQDPDPPTRAGVTILRDPYDVPHVYGVTRDDVTWGSGWVEAEDRNLLLGQARYDSELAAVDAPGVSAIGLIGSLQNFKPTAQLQNTIAKQTNTLMAAGAQGRAVLHDIDVYLQGINAWYAKYSPTTPVFTRTDIYALNALKDQFVGEGGGQQATNGEFLAGLQQHLGSKKGMEVWNDLREAYDPEAPVSVPGHVQFQPKPTSLSGNVMLAPDSLSSSATGALDVQRDFKGHASNALLVSAKRSATHHPIMVAGPQIGYYYPGLTLEMDLEGPGIHEDGATAAPFPGYMLIGRSQDFAWSLTSAGLDQITTYAETLCGNGIHEYIFQGRCTKMQFFDAGTLDPGGKDQREITFYRTVHGAVIGYAKTKQGRMVALAQKRSSYGKDVLDLLFYHDLSDGSIHNVHQFFKAASLTPQTFNSLYVDDKDIGVYTSGLVPIQPSNVDQDLPVNGTGKEEWRGYVSAKNHPQGINPPNGEIINWNNRTEAGYEAPDDNWTLGSLQRVDLLIDNLGHGSNLTPARVVSAMNEAATQDVREMTFEPVLSKLLHGGKAPNARDAKMLALLDAWHQHGGSRLDRTDSNGMGNITDPGAAIMDAAWTPLADAWASTVLGKSLTAQLASFVTPFDSPPGGQYTGWYMWMQKDIRTILGEQVNGKFAIRYCGGGNLAKCRKLMWAAINKAGDDLQTQQGSNPSAWHASATAEMIGFVPGLLPYMMRYTNRPTGIQQVLSFGGHAPADTGR
jgi:acyl-homoserine lactone acylase PvdQ